MTINEKFYNYCQNQECSLDVDVLPDEVLAPMLIEDEDKFVGMNLKNHTLKMHTRAGKRYRVAFVPVKAEAYELMEKEYNRALNNYLDNYRRPRSKFAPEFTSYEDWVTGNDFKDTGVTTDIDNYLVSEMLVDLFEEVDKLNTKFTKLFSALVDNDSEFGKDEVFEQAGMKRSTAYNHLPKLRQLVKQILEVIN